MDSVLLPPRDCLGAETTVGEDYSDVRPVDLPCGAIDLLQDTDTDADGRSAVSVPPVLALDGPDTTPGIDSTHIAGVVAGAAELLCLAAVPSHQVPYSELESTMVQGVQFRDPQPQSTGTHPFPLGPLPRLPQPKATGSSGDHGSEKEDPPVRHQPLHDGEQHTDRHGPCCQQGNPIVLLLGTADRWAPSSPPHRAAPAHRTTPS
jgi:hypothetical protein